MSKDRLDGFIPRKVHGPYAEGSRYILQCVDATGHKKKLPYPTERGAKNAKTRMLNDIERNDKIARDISSSEIPPYDGTLQWWARAMGMLGQAVAEGAGVEKRADLKAISGAAIAAQKLHDDTEMLARLDAVEKRQREITSFRRDGTKIAGHDPNREKGVTH